MTPSELKYNVKNTGSHYFDHSSMKSFGDTMSNYGVRSAEVQSNYTAEGDYVGADGGITVQVWELYRKRPVKHSLKDSAYFAKDDYRRVYRDWV